MDEDERRKRKKTVLFIFNSSFFDKSVKVFILGISFVCLIWEFAFFTSFILSFIDLLYGGFVVATINILYDILMIINLPIIGILGISIFFNRKSDNTVREQYRGCMYIFVITMILSISILFYLMNFIVIVSGYGVITDPNELESGSNPRDHPHRLSYSFFTGLIGIFIFIFCCGFSDLIGIINYETERNKDDSIGCFRLQKYGCDRFILIVTSCSISCINTLCLGGGKVSSILHHREEKKVEKATIRRTKEKKTKGESSNDDDDSSFVNSSDLEIISSVEEETSKDFDELLSSTSEDDE